MTASVSSWLDVLEQNAVAKQKDDRFFTSEHCVPWDSALVPPVDGRQGGEICRKFEWQHPLVDLTGWPIQAQVGGDLVEGVHVGLIPADPKFVGSLWQTRNDHGSRGCA